MTDSGNTYNITATNVVNTVRDGGIGFQQNFGSPDLDSAIRQIVLAAAILRPCLSTDDGAELDDAVRTIDAVDAKEPRALVPALKSVMGIAGMAGEAGKSLFEAAAQAKDLIGL